MNSINTVSHITAREPPLRFIKKCMLTLLAFSTSLIVDAQTAYQVKSVKATVKGSSSLHDWESQITKIECKGTFLSKGKVLTSIKNVKVKIAVEGIKSKEGKVMDKKTYEAFKSSKNPFIICELSMATVKTDANNEVTIEAISNLTMAGTTKKVPLMAKGKVLANGDIQLSGSKKLIMSEYNMQPPTAVLGTIKVGDEVTVSFDLLLVKSKEDVKLFSKKIVK